MKTSYLPYLLSATVLAGLPLASPAYAQSDTATADKAHSFSIPAGRLSQSVLALSEQADVQVVFDSDTTSSVQGNAVQGSMPLDHALDRLVSGTDLTWRWLRNGVVTIESASGGTGELVTGAVQVEGAQGSPYFGGAGQAAGVNGTNGSRDITATEGTGSFTSGALTIGSKVPQALKDVPQSISVLTSERMAQQNVTDFATAMKQLPGITLIQGNSSLETTFYSRGFSIKNFQVDGGAPLSTAFGFQPQIDMSVYDHVELLRGAAGEFGSYGTPGGTVNLVRKRALDHAQYTLEAQAGSWSNYRLVADATSPLALDGKLRGRLVMTYEDRKYYYETATNNKSLIYGVVELDVTSNTIATGGISYTRQNSVPFMSGLPRYYSGDDLKLPRSTCLCFDWNLWDFVTTEIFGSIEQKIGTDWTAKFNLTHNRQATSWKMGQVIGGVNPTTGTGPILNSYHEDTLSRQLSAEATISGAFTLFGQRQEVTIGANRADTNGGGWLSYASASDGSIPVDVFDFDPDDPLYAEPYDTLPYYRIDDYGDVQSAAYISLRLTAFDRLHLTTGVRWSQYSYKWAYSYLCTNVEYSCADKAIGDVYYSSDTPYVDEDFSWPPPVNLSFDVTKNLTAYVGYTNVYVSQANNLTADLKPLPPITGSNWEAGLKWAARDGRLNISLAVYDIEQKGFAQIDPPDYSGYYEVAPGITCCYIPNPHGTYESRGVDLEVTGELVPGWQVSASYTYSENMQTGFGYSEGQPFTSMQPKNLYKIWTSYDFGAGGASGALSGLTVSGGINGQSSGYYAGTVCTTDYYTPYPEYPTYRKCDTPEEPFDFTVAPYAVVSGRLDYRLSDKWSLAVNLENVFDKTYYQTVGGGVTTGSWYGTPRSFTASLRARW